MVIEREGLIAHVWLNRPERRNALNQKALEEIVEVFDWLQTQYEIKVVTVGGRGASFCAGADMKEPPGLARISASSGVSSRERHWLANLGRRALEAVERLDAVTIARIHGHAIGGGLLLALACDLRIAAEKTLFFFPEVELGNPLDWRGVPRLIREVGLARAKELVFLSGRIDANQAEHYGLLNRVVPQEQLDATVHDWANRLAEKPEVVVRMSKAQFRACTSTLSIGEIAEFEGALLLEALRDEVARSKFGPK